MVCGAGGSVHGAHIAMLNVLLIYYEPIRAGQTTHVLGLARGLSARGHGVTVVLPDQLVRGAGAFVQAGADVVPLPLRKVAWPTRSMATVARLIRGRSFDVVHVHSQEAGLLGRAVAWAAGAPAVVYTPQVIDIRRARWHWLYVLLERLLAQVTDAVISVSEADRERLIGWGISPEKVVTLANGIDLQAFNGGAHVTALRQELGLERGCPLVMQVGRLSAQKDPLAFVEGAARVVKMCPKAQFVMVGEGPLRDAVVAHARELGVDGHLHLTGWRADAAALMRAADLVTLTSRWEGMPHTLLEAMACSRPVVATAVNGCPEVVAQGTSGFLVPPGDVASWAGRVVELLRDSEMRARMGKAGRERVEEAFSLEGVVSRIEEMYMRVSGDG